MSKNNNAVTKIVNPKTGEEIDVPVKGSLGLLALGAVGVRAWRAAKKKAKEEQNDKKDN